MTYHFHRNGGRTIAIGLMLLALAVILKLLGVH